MSRVVPAANAVTGNQHKRQPCRLTSPAKTCFTPRFPTDGRNHINNKHTRSTFTSTIILLC